MKIRWWHVVSFGLVGIIVLIFSTFGIDNSVRGTYDGDSASAVLQHISPSAWLLYAAYPHQVDAGKRTIPPVQQFDVEVSPLANFTLTISWALFGSIVMLLFFSWIPVIFARPHGWLRTSIGIVLSVILVPVAFFGILTLFNNSGSETFKMLADFGIHESHGFGIDLGGAVAEMLRVPFSTFLLSVPNVILLIVCLVKGKDGRLMKVLFPHS